ncbi:hypothetical protein VSS74_04055 [Conexibacter stalactiti]|uniref:Uncharacterized protein n=1 Tax=Conexibacter stalactiti TaxID=1940611 RepID=A0ABU4HJL0_9ACTN|nr:hypothetical protein [Conexibacter stalactiti]MDW5593496.1 hypothetical protein [Conexibacter stalactiti]MEC5034137.1 hypothetical protein [Conexibacter stalactiti]
MVPSTFPNPAYRAIWPMEELMRRGHDVRFLETPYGSELPSVERFADRDVVYMWQMFVTNVRAYVKALQEAGVAVIWDSDDDVSAVPKGAVNYRAVGGMQGQRVWREMQTMVRTVDAVTTTGEALAAKFRTTGQPEVHTIENFLPDVGRQGSTSRGDVVVGWVAAGEHSTDAAAIGLRETLARMLDAHPGLRFETVGVALDLRTPQYHRIGIVAITELRGCIERWDIGIAPLADTQFNRARSNVKLKEYAAVGVPWLASPIGPYAGLGEEQGGRLVGDGEWFDAIVDLAGDRKARKKLGAKAYKWAKTQTIAKNADQWERVLERAIEVRRLASERPRATV